MKKKKVEQSLDFYIFSFLFQTFLLIIVAYSFFLVLHDDFIGYSIILFCAGLLLGLDISKAIKYYYSDGYKEEQYAR